MYRTIPIRKKAERGFSLIMIAVCSVVMFGMLGLTTDLGRVYIVKNELQAFVDASSVAAALQLNGSQSGLTAADAAAASGPPGPAGTYNGWRFDSLKVPAPAVSYSTTYGGSYFSSSSGSVDPAARFVQVQATVRSPIYFLPIIPGIANSLAVSAVATAGLSSQNSLPAGGTTGAAPFSPDAHVATSANFGFTKGQLYTLRMTPPGHGGATCAGDNGWTDPNPPQDRGYINLGQGNSNGGIGDVLDNNTTYGLNITPNIDIPWVPGQKDVRPFVRSRFNQDTNTNQTETYAQYMSDGTGNGRRIMIVPVNDPVQSSIDGAAYIIGFAAFFLQNDFASYHSNADALCGEYIGPATLNSKQPGPTPAGPGTVYIVQLFQ
jgi:Flp pilus assembly protein TadG